VENDPALEHALLEHLRFAPLSRAELVRRTGVSDKRVQAALNDLIRGTFVAKRPQDGGPADYELTKAGTGRLDLLEDLVESPLKTMGKVFGAMVVQVVRPLQPPGTPLEKLRLSDDDRSACSTALADQFAAGRIDQAELGRRTDLLLAARIREDLDPVFEGLPPPTLAAPYQPPPGTRPPTWGTLAWILLPVAVVVAIIVGHVVSSGASAPVVVLFVLLVAARIGWAYRGRRFRQ
jgi:DNA-binding HxlR family transcriptional regulator